MRVSSSPLTLWSIMGVASFMLRIASRFFAELFGVLSVGAIPQQRLMAWLPFVKDLRMLVVGTTNPVCDEGCCHRI